MDESRINYCLTVPDSGFADGTSKMKRTATQTIYCCWLEDLTNRDVPVVGGKNASLGELIQSLGEKGVRVPAGFATTSDAYREFLTENDFDDRLKSELDNLERGALSLAEAGYRIRQMIRGGNIPAATSSAIRHFYRDLCKRENKGEVAVAVRSSATAEDLSDASFAGQQETFLNIVGEEDLLKACRECYASLFTDRAIAYRKEKGFDHLEVALSIGVQVMVRADKAGAGVMFSINTECGFPDVVVINATWGLGENVVQGTVNPDEYKVFKPLLKDNTLSPIIEKALGTKEKTMVYANGGNKKTKNEN